MISLDYSVILQILFFLLFWFLMDRIIFKPFLGLLDERERRTEGAKAETAALIEEAERLRAEYESGMAKAQEEAEAVKEAILVDARRSREQLLTQAREEAGKMIERSRSEIRIELQKARELVRREAEAIARQMTEKILGRRLG
ncbi:MAG TPA: ATP synthase F0 subunit B [Candidatus Binatia bacterium]|jgi:F-type H+-transporting ATPase subunit b|nr:ATP synthase F0 subunit B [Candidatus Binatia bacterium]